MLYVLLALFLLAVILDGQRKWRRRSYRLRQPTGRRPEDNFTEDQRAEIFERDGSVCVYCGVEVHRRSKCDWVDGCNHCGEVDHYVAVANGGPTTVANGVTACRFHNRAKGSKSVESFLDRGGRR